MLRDKTKAVNRFYILSCGGVCFLSFLLAYFSFSFPRRFDLFLDYTPSMILFSVLFVAILSFRSLSMSGMGTSYYYLFKQVLIGLFWAVVIYGFFSYGFKMKHISRKYIVFACVLSFILTYAWLCVSFWRYKKIRKNVDNLTSVCLVGNQFTSEQVIRTIQENPNYGMRIVGILPLAEKDFDGDQFMGAPVYDSQIERIETFLNDHVIDSIFITVYRQNPQLVEKVILACQDRGIEVHLKPDFIHQALQVSKADHLGPIPFFVFSLLPSPSLGLMIKRGMDLVLSIFALVLLALPMAVIAFMIERESPGPAIFVQKRVGVNGRRFYFYKFRSMYKDSEQRREQYHQKNEMQGPVFKMKEDPRITPFGRILRKYSLDELPQLWNVLKGDMSIVGPRPPLPTEVDLYQGWHRRRLSMKPGLTCLWQVSGRNEISKFEDWVKLDLQYIDNWNLLLDLKIILKTFPAVFKGTGI